VFVSIEIYEFPMRAEGLAELLFLKFFFFAASGPADEGGRSFELLARAVSSVHLIDPEQPNVHGPAGETLACDASNMTGLVDRLESAGSVRRCPSSEDRRVESAELTPAGARLRESVRIA